MKFSRLQKLLLACLSYILLSSYSWADSLSPETMPKIQDNEIIQLNPEYENSVWGCFVKEKKMLVLDIRVVRIQHLHFVEMGLDRNNDHYPDVNLLYDVDHVKDGVPILKNPFPHYYVVDENLDGQADKAYRDVNGNAKCEDMEEVPLEYIFGDMNTQQSKGKNL